MNSMLGGKPISADTDVASQTVVALILFMTFY